MSKTGPVRFTVTYECKETYSELDKKIIKALETIDGCNSEYVVSRTLPKPLEHTIGFVIKQEARDGE